MRFLEVNEKCAIVLDKIVGIEWADTTIKIVLINSTVEYSNFEDSASCKQAYENLLRDLKTFNV